jgi:hypothetical protein
MSEWPEDPHAVASPSPAVTLAEVSKIMQQYDELLGKYPAAYIDESWLPVPKERMRQVFKAAWKMAPNAEIRHFVELEWTFLSMFQPSVGATPIGNAIPVDVSPQSVALINRFVELSELAEAETENDLAEMHAFTRASK